MISWVSIADPHLKLHDKWGNINPETGLNTRLEDRLSNIEQAVGYAGKKKVDYFIILGDIFDSINPGERLRGLLLSCLSSLAAAGTKIVIIIGNHDSDGRFFNFMGEAFNASNMNNFLVVAWDIIIDESAGLSAGLAFVPYSKVADIPLIKSQKKKILFSHFLLDKAKVGVRGHRLQSKHPISMLRDFRWFELGDVHKQQLFRNGCYVGSIAKNDFGERAETKGFRYGTFKDGEVKSKFIPVADRPFIEKEITEGNMASLSGFSGRDKGAVLKIVVRGTRDWIKSVRWDNYRTELKSQYSLVRFEFDRIDADKILEKTDLSSTSSIEDAIKNYGRENRFSKEDIKFGLELLG